MAKLILIYLFFYVSASNLRKDLYLTLIADSGSTKTTWGVLKENNEYSEFNTDGINPYYQSEDEIKGTLTKQLLKKLGDLLKERKVKDIHFYGAGCTEAKCVIMKDIFKVIFPEVNKVEVESDMMGAARGSLGKNKGVVSILGTGSNTCLFDGEKAIYLVPSLGFILGDEGSGSVLGKKLVSDLLKNQLSEELKQKFLKQYNTNQLEIIDRVYRKPFPNRYLAQYAKFCSENLKNPLIHKLVYDHFDYFIKRIIAQYPNIPTYFVGSIAFYFKDILQEAMSNNGFKIGKINKSPIEGLKEYHKKYK